MSTAEVMLFLCLTAISVTVSSGQTDKCLHCICQASGCDDVYTGWGLGPFRITWGYWSDAGQLGASYNACVHNMGCSRNTVRGYMSHYVAKPQNKNCERYARVHKGGPWGWPWGTTQFWNVVDECCLDATIMPGEPC